MVKSTNAKHPTKLGIYQVELAKKKLLQLSLTNSKIIRAL